MSRLRKAFLTAAVVVVLGVGLVVAVGWYASGVVIHPPQDLCPYRPGDYPTLSLQDVRFESRDGLELAGWFVPGSNGATIVLAHGRGGYKCWMLPHADYLHEAGYSVLLFDFRYRGESEGDAQTLGTKESWDLQSAVDYLMARPDVDGARIGVLGSSMGAATAILAAAERPEIKGVIADIPFSSVSHLLCHSFEHEFGIPCFPFGYAAKWLSELRLGVDFDAAAPIAAIAAISPRPILLIDNELDELLPSNSVELLYQAAQSPKSYWNVAGASHGKAWDAKPTEYERRVLAFWRDTFGMNAAD